MLLANSNTDWENLYDFQRVIMYRALVLVYECQNKRLNSDESNKSITPIDKSAEELLAYIPLAGNKTYSMIKAVMGETGLKIKDGIERYDSYDTSLEKTRDLLQAICFKFENLPKSGFTRDDSTLLEIINGNVESRLKGRKTLTEQGSSNQKESDEKQNLDMVRNLLNFTVTNIDDFPDSFRATLNLITYVDCKKELIMQSFTDDSVMEDMTRFIIDQAKDLKSESLYEGENKICNHNNQNHIMFVTWMAVCFSIKDDSRFTKSFHEMTANMIHLHGYDGKQIARCVETDKVFSSEIELPIISHLRSKLPALETFGNASGWFKEDILAHIIHLFSFLIYCSDWGTDIQQTVNFHNDFKSINSTIANDTLSNGAFNFNYRIGEDDYLVAFIISIIVLLLTTMIHFIICFTSDVHDPLISFFNGSCCTESMKKNDTQKSLVIKTIIAFFLPFFSKFYVTFLIPIQLYQFRKNWDKIEDLKKNLHESHKERW